MTIEGGAPARRPPRLFEVWDAVETRLQTERMLAILSPDTAARNADRVVVAGKPEARTPRPSGASDQAPWGRLWVVPVTTAWNLPEEVGRHVNVPFSIRVDFYVPEGSAFPLMRRMEAAHEEAFVLLHGWLPRDLEFAKVESAMHREVRPQPMPLWDEARGLWAMTAVFNVYVSPPDLVAP